MLRTPNQVRNREGGHLCACVSAARRRWRGRHRRRSAVGARRRAARLTGTKSVGSCTFAGLWQPARPLGECLASVQCVAGPGRRAGRAPGLTPAASRHGPRPGHWNTGSSKVRRALAAPRAWRSPGTHQGSALVQTKRPAATTCRRRSRTSTASRHVCGCLAAGHRRRHRPEPLHAVGQPRTSAIYNRDGTPGRQSRSPATALGRQSERAELRRGQRRRPDRPLRPVRGPLVRRRSSRIRTIPNGPFYQCVAVSTTNDPSGTWCGYEYIASRDQAERLSQVRRLADPERLHGHDQPVHRARLTAGAASASWRFERDEMMRGRPRADALQGHVRRGTEPLGRHAPGRPRRSDDAAGERACAADRGRRRRVGPAELPADRLDVWNATVDWSGPGGRSPWRTRAPPDGAVRRDPLRLRRRACRSRARLSGSTRSATGSCTAWPTGTSASHQAIVVNHTVDVGADHAGSSLVRR